MRQSAEIDIKHTKFAYPAHVATPIANANVYGVQVSKMHKLVEIQTTVQKETE